MGFAERTRDSAIHEAGHALVGILRGYTVVEAVLGVTGIERGHVQFAHDDGDLDHIVAMAGAAAESILWANFTPDEVTGFAMVVHAGGASGFGIDGDILSCPADKCADAFVEAEQIIRRNWSALIDIANALLAADLTGDEVVALAGDARWPR